MIKNLLNFPIFIRARKTGYSSDRIVVWELLVDRLKKLQPKF